MKALILFIREIFKIASVKNTTFFVEHENLPLRLKYFVLQFVYLYLKAYDVLLDAYYRFWIRGCFQFRAFYCFAFHGLVLLRDDDLFDNNDII